MATRETRPGLARWARSVADADEKFDGLVSGGLDWSDALEARMTVSNEGREKVHMAMTADGNSRGRGLGWLARAARARR